MVISAASLNTFNPSYRDPLAGKLVDSVRQSIAFPPAAASGDFPLPPLKSRIYYAPCRVLAATFSCFCYQPRPRWGNNILSPLTEIFLLAAYSGTAIYTAEARILEKGSLTPPSKTLAEKALIGQKAYELIEQDIAMSTPAKEAADTLYEMLLLCLTWQAVCLANRKFLTKTATVLLGLAILWGYVYARQYLES